MRPRQWIVPGFAVLLAASGLAEVALDPATFDRPTAARVLTLVAAAAMLALSRLPLVSLTVLMAVVTASASVPALKETLTASVVLGSVIALGAVARRQSRRTGQAAFAGTLILYVGWALLAGRPWDAIAMVLFCSAAWSMGRLLRREADRSAALTALTAELAAEREARAREAVDAERTRIARELHDAVAHTVSVMTLQTGAVRRRLQTDSRWTRERDVLLAVERLGREAVDELHRTVGILRTAGEPDPETSAPQPRLDNLDQLTTRLQAAGLSVDLQIDGRARPLPRGLDLVAYRITQEALTNTLKHAGPAHAHVTVHYADDHIIIEISDDGHGLQPSNSPGHGLAGMRERVALYGGHIHTGPGHNGGYLVRATLPAPKEPPG
jgi:signal transduction histidine kinase